MKSKSKSVVVMGAGIGGLSVAALLGSKGFKVKIIEKNSIPGGRAGILKSNGFTFDIGPSWFMMPDVFDDYLKLLDTSLEKELDLFPLDPQYRVFFRDGSDYDLRSDHKKNKIVFESLEKGAGKKFEEYLDDSKNKYEIAKKQLLYKNMGSLSSYLSLDLLANGLKMGPFKNMHKHVSHYFNSEKLQQILEYNLVFIGCSPDNAPSLFSMMAHVDFNLGVYYPRGGFYKVVEMLVKLCKQNGVEFVFDTEIKSVMTRKNTVVGVKTSKGVYKSDILISNADYKHTEDLLDDHRLRNISEKSWDNKTMAPSAFIIYLGVKGKIKKLTHHNLYFDNDWRNHFRSVFDKPAWPINPSIYINMPSATDDSIAPIGHENLMILVPVGVNLEENDSWREMYADYIISYAEKHLNIQLAKNIVYKKIFSVSDFRSEYNSYKGNALGGMAHTLTQSAYFRPGNKSRKLSNFYFVGAGTNPGIGVPTSLLSGQVLAGIIQNEHV